MSTIIALATATGRAGIQVVRCSGPKSLELLFGHTGLGDPEPGRMYYRAVKDNVSRETLDRGLVVYFQGPSSFTGEDVVEFHLHGAPVIARALLDMMAKQHGVRHAQAGEFTRRALENARMSLSEVEALGQLLMADTRSQLRVLEPIFDGRLQQHVEGLRRLLIQVASRIEASIDFDDEGDVPKDVANDLANDLGLIDHRLAQLMDVGARNQHIFEGVKIAIIGAPNTGKSSLINYLAGHDLALVSDIPGTTRDVLRAEMDIAGVKVTFYDTAGLRVTDDQVEQLGIARSHEVMRQADMHIIMTEGHLSEDDVRLLADYPQAIHVTSKSDLGGISPENALHVSTKTGAHMDVFLGVIGERLQELLPDMDGEAGLINQRQLAACGQAMFHVKHCLELSKTPERVDLLGEELRASIQALDELIGKVSSEDVLGEIFAHFCIGK